MSDDANRPSHILDTVSVAYEKFQATRAVTNVHTVVDVDGQTVTFNAETVDISGVRETYLRGQCGALAVAIAEQNDWDVGIVLLEEDEWGNEMAEDPTRAVGWRNSFMPPDTVDGIRYGPNVFPGHLVALTPDGKNVVDIDGERDAEDFLKDWKERHQGATFARIRGADARVAVESMRNDGEHDGGLILQNFGAAQVVATWLFDTDETLDK